MRQATCRQVAPERAEEWLAKGHRLRHFFAHRLFHVPKCGPDGYRLAQAMCGITDVTAHWQQLLYADPALISNYPHELFFDDDLIWHQQHFGRAGQVATASMVLDGHVLYSLGHMADLVQRISRFREHRSQIEKRLRGWPWMVLNGVLAFAAERGVRTVRTPGAELAIRHTDVARTVQPYLFERVYDRPAADIPGADRDGEWWVFDVAEAAAAVVWLTPAREPLAEEKVVWRITLEAALAAETGAGVQVTYNVVGQIFDEVRGEIEDAGHAVAFHSFDHSDGSRQLERCRELDYRLKGYRVPGSRITEEISDERLAVHNFEWLASGRSSLGTASPVIRNRLVRIPVSFDDFPLYTGARTYEEWEQAVLEHVEREAYTAIGLPDCYAHPWLGRYPELLRKVTAAAQPRTFDQVSADVIIGAAA